MTIDIDIAAVLAFLRCRTPAAWLERAVTEREALLLDHAALELKAAQQAQRLIWKYGGSESGAAGAVDDTFRRRLANKMSRLAREELRHFEQVLAQLESRGRMQAAVPASRYAASLHARSRRSEPEALVDQLLIGAIIEARSCERFFSLVPLLAAVDAPLASFYASLLKSEARHFEDYLALADDAARGRPVERLDELLALDAELVESPDARLAFHSGPPV